MNISICLNSDVNDLSNISFLLKKMNIYFKDSTIDYFIHTWGGSPIVDEYINIVNPKNYIIDKKPLEFINNMNIKFYEHYNIINSMDTIYSTMCSGELKRGYEIENDIKYDLCINININTYLTSDDLDINLKKLNGDTIYVKYFTNNGSFPFEKVGYHFYVSNSETFDILSSFYKFLFLIKEDIFDKNINVSELFAYYVRMFRINISVIV